MGYKKIDKSLDFADLALASSLKHNRSLKLMEEIDKAIDWSRIETILMSHYVVGTSSEGADAYPSRNSYLFPSANQRLITQHTLDLEKDCLKKLWIKLIVKSSVNLKTQGLTINEGVAIDARLVKSAFHPIGNKEIKKQKKNRNTPEGKLDNNGVHNEQFC